MGLFLVNTYKVLSIFTDGAVVKNSPAKAEEGKRQRFDPWVGKLPWSRKWQPTPELLPGKSHGQRSLVGYSLWGCKESDTTECGNIHIRSESDIV